MLRLLRRYLLLLPLAGLILFASTKARFEAPFSVDSETYMEMIEGISVHGLPYTDNGAVAEFCNLRPRWNIPAHGHLWGKYPPIYPYLMAPVYGSGGMAGVSQCSVLLLLFLGLAVFRLGESISGSKLFGVTAAYFVLLGLPTASSSIDFSPVTLAIFLTTWLSVIVINNSDTSRLNYISSFFAGLLAAAAIGSHLLVAPIVFALIIILWRRLEREVGSGLKLLYLALGIASIMVPISILNHIRFGTFNPLTYGPCVWETCSSSGQDQESIAGLVRALLPLLPMVVGVWLSLISALKRKFIMAISLFGATILLCASVDPIKKNLLASGALLWSFIVDISIPHISEYTTPSDGLGYIWGPWAVKALIQDAPLLSLAFVSPLIVRRDRGVLSLWASSIALIFFLVLRTGMPAVHALGFSFLTTRYLHPILPLFGVLALLVVSKLPGRRWLILGSGIGLVVFLSIILSYPDDLGWVRRFLLLRFSIYLSASVVICTLLWRFRGAIGAGRAASILAGMCISYSLVVTSLVDLQALYNGRIANQRLFEFAKQHTRQRHAIFGEPHLIHFAAALRFSHDVEYADTWECRFTEDGDDQLHALILRWLSENRPVYGLCEHIETCSWPDLVSLPVENGSRLFQVVKR